MKWYRNLTVTRQLFAVVAALIVGFGAIGFTYYRVLVIESTSTENLEGILNFQGLVESARADMLIAQRYALDFQINNRLEALEGFDTTMNRAVETTGRLSALSPSSEGEAVIAELIAAESAYQTSIYAAAEPQLAIGLDSSSGLIGDLQDVADSFVRSLKGNPDSRIEASFLRLRSNEKEYLASREQESVDASNAEVKILRQLIRQSSMKSGAKTTLLSLANNYFSTIEELVANIEVQTESRSNSRSIANELEPSFNFLTTLASENVATSRASAGEQSTQNTLTFIAALAAIFVVMSTLLVLLARKLTGSLGILQTTVAAVGSGDLDARTGLLSEDELGSLGKAFDNMLDERLTQLRQSASENEQLNESVVKLMEAVSKLSERDLTVKVPVSEDVTGPVADAINLMAEETAKVLAYIEVNAKKVGKAAVAVQGQGDKVATESENERRVVAGTLVTLNKSSNAMKEIATLAQHCSDLSAHASKSTTSALEAVESTSSGMNDIRETISETEKRIKRLGERSQEISTVVDIINGIAERTHVLALNASMQAAAAGEAGRGFAVVADEVQRLAESSRESTSQIGALVKNIQVETAETMATMNKTIGQVVDGTDVARLAGEKMKETNDRSEALRHSVQKIAVSSTQQAEATKKLLAQASEIEASTERTRKAIEVQSSFSGQLVKFSRSMLQSVGVFKLPEIEGVSQVGPEVAGAGITAKSNGRGESASLPGTPAAAVST